MKLAAVSSLAAATLLSAGCDGTFTSPPQGAVKVPAPINLLLPRSMRIHEFTKVRQADPSRGVPAGIDVRIEALDSFGDACKAFGTFRFEAYAYRPNSADPKGDRIDTWDVSVAEPRANAIHWDAFSQKYEFHLNWSRPVTGVPPVVLVAVFQSDFTPRMIDERRLVK